MEIPIGNLFCGSCGTKIDRSCTKCGNVVPPPNIFCGSCGANLNDTVGSNVQKKDDQSPETQKAAITLDKPAEKKISRQTYGLLKQYAVLDSKSQYQMRLTHHNIKFEELLEDEDIQRDINNPDQAAVVNTYKYAPPASHTTGISSRPSEIGAGNRSTEYPNESIYKSRSDAPGKNFLRVSGILLIIFGALSIVTSYAGLATAGLWDIILPIGGMSWSTYYTLAMLSAVYAIIMGIVGIANCTRLENAGLCKTFAIISILIRVVFLFIGVVFGVYAALGLGGLSLVLTLLDFILPVLYYIGAQKNLGY